MLNDISIVCIYTSYTNCVMAQHVGVLSHHNKNVIDTPQYLKMWCNISNCRVSITFLLTHASLVWYGHFMVHNVCR